MKRIVGLLLVAAMCLSLAACGKSEEAKACEDLIKAVGTVTLESEAAITAAEEAYEALTDEQKEEVKTSAEKLPAYREAYEELVKLNKVEELIAAIGTVTTDSAAAIETAEAAFGELTDEQKGKIQESGDKLTAARTAYEDAVVKAVTDSINSIGTVTLDSRELIETAKEMYNSLSDECQGKVANYAALEAAEAQLDQLLAAEKAKIQEKYLPKFNKDYDKVQDLTWYMHKNMPAYIDTRCYLIPYIGCKDGDKAWICIRYDYTGDDWVFWENLTILVDGEKYYKHVGHFDTVRDNSGGYVWEWYDECLDFNQPMNTDEIEMLRKISESKETIVRFQGDDYHHDLTVGKTDKQIIKDVLALYDALLP